MSGKKLDKRSYGQMALTALCAAGLFSVIFIWKGLFPFGNGSIVMTDLYSQYVPLLYRFYDVVCGEKNLFLDFSVSGGANLYVDTINEIINPFNYVLFLFGRDKIYQAVNVILLLYVTAAAVSADFFLQRIWPKDRSWNVVLSLCYALSGYAAYNFQIIKWMYFPVLFPLFALALRRLWTEKKGGLYALLLGYQLMLSIQLGFMTLLFTLFASGIYFFCCVEKKDRSAVMCRLGLDTAAGLLLSAVVLVPNVLILLSSSRAGENLSYFGVMRRHGLDDLFERLFQIAHPVLMAMFLWLAARTERRQGAGSALGRTREEGNCRKKNGIRYLCAGWDRLPREGRFLIALTFFLWLTVLLEPANLLWHLGSYVCFPVRYAYMVLLAEVALVKWMLQIRTEKNAGEIPQGFMPKKQKKRNILWGVVAGGALGLAVLAAAAWESRIVQAFSSLAISRTCRTETLMVCGILLLLFVAALCALKIQGRAAAVFVAGLAAAACAFCFHVFLIWPKDYAVRLEDEAAYQKMTLQAQQAETDSVLPRVEDDPQLPLNAALVNRTNSLSGYFPTASQGYQQALEELGYLVPWVATQSVGGTVISDDLLSCALLLGDRADALQPQGKSVLERQAELAKQISQKELLLCVPGEKLQRDADGNMVLHLEGRKTLYLDPGMTADCFTVWIDGEKLEMPEPSAAFSPHRLIELGTFTDQEVILGLSDLNGNAIGTDGMELGFLDRDAWEETVGRIRDGGSAWRKESAYPEDDGGIGESAWQEDDGGIGEGVSPEGDGSTGNVTRALSEKELLVDVSGGWILVTLSGAAEGQTVFLPFAALDGWKCVQNGRNVDIVSVFGGFMGINTVSGENEIVLRFTPPGWKAGLLLTILGALVWGVLRCIRSESTESIRTKSIGFLYRVLLVGAFILIYLIPAVGLVGYLAAKVLGIGG